MPVGVDKCVLAAKELQENSECSVDLYLKSAIEGVVIKWVTQINDVMTETSANAFNNGQNPVPTMGEFFRVGISLFKHQAARGK
jgi:dynein heavy chain